MKWQRGTRNDHVVDVRGRKYGAPEVAGGSVVVVLLAIVVSQLLGVDVTGLIG